MISNTTIQLHAPDGLKANRNGEYKEVGVLHLSLLGKVSEYRANIYLDTVCLVPKKCGG